MKLSPEAVPQEQAVESTGEALRTYLDGRIGQKALLAAVVTPNIAELEEQKALARSDSAFRAKLVGRSEGVGRVIGERSDEQVIWEYTKQKALELMAVWTAEDGNVYQFGLVLSETAKVSKSTVHLVFDSIGVVNSKKHGVALKDTLAQEG